MMEEKSCCARRRTDIIIGAVFVLLLLIIYFSPSEISSRYRRALLQFPTEGYVAAQDSQQYAVKATITLSSSGHKDEHEPDKEFITAKLHLEIYNNSVEPLRDFRWVGEFDQELQGYLSRWTMPWLNDPGIYTSYSMLLSKALSPKHDIYPQDAVVPDYKPGDRRQPTSGFIYGHQGLAFWYSATDDELDVVLACLQKPIKLKLMHEGGTDYLLVYPEVDHGAITR